MALNLTIRHWQTNQTTEHAVEPSEPINSLLSNLIVFWGLKDDSRDPVSLATGQGNVVDPSQTFMQAGLHNGDGLVIGPRSSLLSQSVAVPDSRKGTKIRLRIREYDGRKIRLNNLDAESIGIDDGDLVRLKDEYSGTFAVGQVELDGGIQRGELYVDPMTVDCLGASSDQEVSADSYPVETLKSLTNITLGIRPLQGAPEEGLLVSVREKENELARLTNRRVVVLGQKFRWKEMNVIVQVLETDPPLAGEEVGLVSTDVLQGFSYRLVSDEASFDGILLIDLSFSMEKDDFEVKNIQHVLDYMSGSLTSQASIEFLRHIQSVPRVERYQAAILAAMMYLVGKIARGKGERISIVLFSDQPGVVNFDGAYSFDVATRGKDVGRIADVLISSVGSIRKRSTKMAPAISCALDLARVFDSRRQKMVVLLTDGRPDDPGAADALISSAIAPRKDMVLFIAGIGEEVDQPLMRKWAAATGGEFLQVRDLNELADWYGSLSRKLTFRASGESLKGPDARPG